MKRIFILFFLFSFFFLTFDKVKAENLGAGLFCDKFLYTDDWKSVKYDFDNVAEEDLKYFKDDEVVCYLSIYYDGDSKYNQISFKHFDNDYFKFLKFEKNDVFDTELTEDDNKVVLKSNNLLSGSIVVGKIYYTMLMDGDDLEVNISDILINDYDVTGGEISGIINGTYVYEGPIEDPVKEEPQKHIEVSIKKVDNEDIYDSSIYLYIAISFILMILILISIMIKNSLKTRNLFK